MNRKSMIVAMLFAMVVLSLVFLPISSQSGTYDPWADYNGDGIIDIDDVMPAALAYGTSGDPTKNVTITGHVTKLIKAADGVHVAATDSWWSDWITVDGYSKMTINIYFPTTSNVYELQLYDYAMMTMFLAERVIDFGYYFVKTYDVMNQKIRVGIANYGAAAASLWVYIYLMA